MGIIAAIGKYREDWFLCFMGLENYPDFRPGGRLTNYLKNLTLSDRAFDYLTTYIKNAAENVEKFCNENPDVYTAQGKFAMLMQLSKTNLQQMVAAIEPLPISFSLYYFSLYHLCYFSLYHIKITQTLNLSKW